MRKRIVYLLLVLGALSNSCSKSGDSGGSGINIFTIDDDKQLGNQLEQEIASDPVHYPLLDSAKYATAYGHINRIVNTILNSGKVEHRNDFDWRVRLIHDDSTLNAFCGPGGKVYVYTGIIKYLDNEDQLAGVLGHEIAHAARRHVTQEMTKAYGINLLLDVVLGKNHGALADIAAGLVTLKFSRTYEAEADQYSVIYLCPTEYKSDGAAGFFTKLLASGQGSQVPVFLSDHPGDESRVTSIESEAGSRNCGGSGTFESRYADFKSSLP